MRAGLILLALLAVPAQALDIPKAGVDRATWCHPNPYLAQGSECGPEPHTLIAHNCAESPGTFGHFPQAIPAQPNSWSVGSIGNGFFYWGYSYGVNCYGGDYGWDYNHAYGASVFYHCAAETPETDPRTGPWGWHDTVYELERFGGFPGCKDVDCPARRQKMLDTCNEVGIGMIVACTGLGVIFKRPGVATKCYAETGAIVAACKMTQPECR